MTCRGAHSHFRIWPKHTTANIRVVTSAASGATCLVLIRDLDDAYSLHGFKTSTTHIMYSPSQSVVSLLGVSAAVIINDLKVTANFHFKTSSARNLTSHKIAPHPF
jgi:hypothetical protein